MARIDTRACPDMIAAHLTRALESDNVAVIPKAIGGIARSRRMSTIAEKS